MEASTTLTPPRTPTRETTTAIVVVHGICAQKPGGLAGSVAGGLEGFLAQQVNRDRSVEVQRSDNRIDFTYIRRRRRRNVMHRVVLLETCWADARLRPGPLRSLAWLARFSPALIAFLFAPDQRDLDATSRRDRTGGRRCSPGVTRAGDRDSGVALGRKRACDVLHSSRSEAVGADSDVHVGPPTRVTA